MSAIKDDTRMVQSMLNSHYHNVQGKNKEYFQTVLLGHNKDQIKIQDDYKKREPSTYIESFEQREGRFKADQTQQLYQDFDVKFPMDLHTNHKLDYQRRASVRSSLMHPDHVKPKVYLPFGENSSYRNQFQNWGYQKGVAFHNEKEWPTVSKETSFQGKTLYQGSFNQTQSGSCNDHQNDRLLNGAKYGRMYNNPIGATINFDGMTTNLKNFKKGDRQCKKPHFVSADIVLIIRHSLGNPRD